MKLHCLTINKSGTCDGLLDGLVVPFHQGESDLTAFSPLCLIGPNGSGKSQVLQIIAEIFQMIFSEFLPNEERGKGSDDIEFVLEYSLTLAEGDQRIRISRVKVNRKKPTIRVEVFEGDNWLEIEDAANIKGVLPSKIIGYTSGDNETLSIPFLVSRSAYAHAVTNQANQAGKKHSILKDPRLMLIDYGTNLEVLLANLLLNPKSLRKSMLEEIHLRALRSFRCVIQLNHPQAPSGGIRLTEELQGYVDALVACATKKTVDKKRQIYDLTFFVTEATHQAFEHYWPNGAIHLYSSLHKLAMLNDLIIPKAARQIFDKELKARKLSGRLPEPYEGHKVFRIESVEFVSDRSGEVVEYISLSDGEHQLIQLLGVACMVCERNTLFLLDEPESHFNPNWRIEFISKLINQQTKNGQRKDSVVAAMQDCLITTHSPFVPSDLKRTDVLIFSKSSSGGKIGVRRPEIETYGSKFDAILAECFGISPSISAITRNLVDGLLKDGTKEEIANAIAELGESSARMKLAAKLALLNGE